MKIGLGVVTAGGWANFIPAQFTWSLWALHSEILTGKFNMRLPDDQQVTSMTLIRSGKFPTDAARNEICQKALDDGVDALVFIDADHSFMPEAVARLIAANRPVITGRYHVKAPPFQPTLYVFPKGAHIKGKFKSIHYGQGIFPVDRCGAGALVIRREVLQAIGFPWFRYAEDPEPPHDLSVSEDFYFCERAQAEGFTIWADWDATFDHISVHPVGEEHRRAYLDLMEDGIASGQSELVDSVVACGFPDGYTLPSGEVVQPHEVPRVG